MKKLIIILGIFGLVNSAKAQTLDTVSVSLTLRAQDWAWAIGKAGEGNDSTSRARIRNIRTQILAANPATWTTNVTINNVPGRVVMYIYHAFITAPFGVVIHMGNTTAERTTIYTNIRAISNSALQSYIAQADAEMLPGFITPRNNGKSIVMDN